ncbi:insulinase family protein [Altererythrobacter sp. TH136]|uniref:M16 family metallopeptidase n=1 Tax=Altererythrobacter sp. TH136 TaxID=2067415 RepID=UPI001163F32E|nr:insulinase family protein [Altererythrobacter sp. TH136]QDM40748.1 insulinase family protein [Altererythrobacter sp. TH136]
MTDINSTAHRARRLPLAVRASLLAIAAAGLAVPASAQDADRAPQTAAQSQTTGIPAWGLTSAELPADPTVRWGILPNGMRYAIRHNETPKGAAVIRFAFNVGMREAEAAQFGAPHFLEHMAFNGSTNIPEGELVKRLERLGLAFGADTNAETDLEHTTYKLDLPNTNAETVDGALTFMRELASELTIDQAAVDRERGIILSEYRVRNVPQIRRLLDSLGKQIPNSRFGAGMTGTPDTIGNISAADLRAFYEGYYRPDRATLVMVGDFDVDAMEQEIRSRFAGWKAKGPAKELYTPAIAPVAKPVVATFTDPSIPEIIEFSRVAGYQVPANSVEEQRRATLEAIASVALSNRLATLSRSADSPIIGGQAMVQDVARTARTATAIVVAKEGQWQPALAIGEQELRRAIQFGFTEAEIAESRANIRTALENAVAQEAGRRSGAIADQIATASLSNSVYLSPAQTLALYNALEPTLTAEEAGKAFRAAWNGGPTLVHVATKQEVGGGIAAVESALATSTQVAVTAPVEQATKAFAYDDFGPAGKVVSDTSIADLGIRSVRFANGVQLNLKKTAFEPGKIAWYAKVGPGAQVFPADKPGLTVASQVLTSLNGLGKHDVDELRRITAGRQVGVGLAVDTDGIVASGATTSADLDLQMKLLAAQLTDPAYDPATQAQWAGIAPVVAKNIASNPSQLASIAVPFKLTGGDARFGFGNPEDLTARSLDEVKAALAPQLASGGVEIGLVGDFDEAAAIAAVAQTLGAVPRRGDPAANPAGVKAVTFTADRTPQTIYHGGSADQGAIALAWPTTDGKNLKDSLTRDLLAGVMGLRLIDVVREELGATYTPNAQSVDSLTYKGFGYLTASAPADPASMDEVAAAVRKIAADLRTNPPTADEMLRARKPTLERWQRQERENNSWVALVSEAQTRSDLLDRRRNRARVLEGITAAEIKAAAQRYLDPAKSVELRVLPKPAG